MNDLVPCFDDLRNQIHEALGTDFLEINNSYRAQMQIFAFARKNIFKEVRADIELIILIELCQGYLSVPMCHGYHIEGFHRVVHWRANAGLLLSHPTISLA